MPGKAGLLLRTFNQNLNNLDHTRMGGEGTYTARASRESIFTEADDFESLDEQIHDAVDCHFNKGAQPRTILWVFNRPVTQPRDA
jgi:hypothetical protein